MLKKMLSVFCIICCTMSCTVVCRADFDFLNGMSLEQLKDLKTAVDSRIEALENSPEGEFGSSSVDDMRIDEVYTLGEDFDVSLKYFAIGLNYGELGLYANYGVREEKGYQYICMVLDLCNLQPETLAIKDIGNIENDDCDISAGAKVTYDNKYVFDSFNIMQSRIVYDGTWGSSDDNLFDQLSHMQLLFLFKLPDDAMNGEGPLKVDINLGYGDHNYALSYKYR